MIFCYGITDFDITHIVLNSLSNAKYSYIPKNDFVRASLFSDPKKYVKKSIFITINENTMTFSEDEEIFIDLEKEKAYSSLNVPDDLLKDNFIANKRLHFIHNDLAIKHGNFQEELPEQTMVAKYLRGNEKVLEIGANVGRNTLVIAYILNCFQVNNQFVTLESDSHSAKLLKENRELNGLKFHIENSALSKNKLIQNGWNTEICNSGNIPHGWKKVNIIGYKQLMEKYKINFDTLVLDCEGAILPILKDYPQLLNNINTIIIENDFQNRNDKNKFNNILKYYNFHLDYQQSGGWGDCQDCFFEVYIR